MGAVVGIRAYGDGVSVFEVDYGKYKELRSLFLSHSDDEMRERDLYPKQLRVEG